MAYIINKQKKKKIHQNLNEAPLGTSPLALFFWINVTLDSRHRRQIRSCTSVATFFVLELNSHLEKMKLSQQQRPFVSVFLGRTCWRSQDLCHKSQYMFEQIWNCFCHIFLCVNFHLTSNKYQNNVLHWATVLKNLRFKTSKPWKKYEFFGLKTKVIHQHFLTFVDFFFKLLVSNFHFFSKLVTFFLLPFYSHILHFFYCIYTLFF